MNTNFSTPDANTVVNTPNAPVNLNSTTLTNNSGAPQTLNGLFGITGTSEIHNTSSSDTTIFSHPMSTPSGSTLRITGAGTTTFSANNSSMFGAVEVSGSSTVNVQSGLGSGTVSLAGTSKLVVQNGATLNNAVATVAGTEIRLQPAANPVTVNQAISGGANIYISGGGTANFTAANPSLSGLVVLNSSTANIADGVNSLGTGELNLAGTSPTVIMGNVTLPNPISATVAATFTSDTGTTAILSGAITGNNTLTFNGTGTKKLTADSPNYTGTVQVDDGKMVVNANFRNASLNVGANGTLGGAGTIGDVILSAGARIRPGNSIAKLYMNTLNSTGNIFTVEVNSAGKTNTVVVAGDATLVNPTFELLKDAGTETGVSNTYKQGVIDYVALQAGGALNVTGPVTVKWLSPAGDGGSTPNPSSVIAGTVSKKTNGVLTNYLVLKETFTDDVTININQTSTDGGGTTGPFH